MAESLGDLKARVENLKEQARDKNQEVKDQYKEVDDRLDEIERVQGDHARRLEELEKQKASQAPTQPLEVVPPEKKDLSVKTKATIWAAFWGTILAIAAKLKGNG